MVTARKLRRALDEATSYEEWAEAARALDEKEGHDRWRLIDGESASAPLADEGIAPNLAMRGHRWFKRELARDWAPGLPATWMGLHRSADVTAHACAPCNKSVREQLALKRFLGRATSNATSVSRNISSS